MKITMDIECTPEEARKFLGLPDVQPLQTALMTELEKRARTEIDRFSPEGLMTAWLSSAPQNAEWFRRLFKGLSDQAGTPAARSD
jgi:hypothetical protein